MAMADNAEAILAGMEPAPRGGVSPSWFGRGSICG